MSDFGAEDEALYSSSKDDKPKRAENTGSAASSLGFCYPRIAGAVASENLIGSSPLRLGVLNVIGEKREKKKKRFPTA